MVDVSHEPAGSERQSSVTLSHLVRVLRTYLPIIGLSLLAVMIAYLLVGVAVYVFSPSQRVTTLSFRLEFEGADRGEYPNGAKFSSAEIISTPVLLKTFEQNHLSRFTQFNKFATSVFVLESNKAQEALARDYQARFSDPRLTAVDRERIQREYELKLASLSKNQYALNYLHTKDTDAIPDVVIRKVLHDILREWAAFVSNEQHVLRYRVPVLAPDVVSASRMEMGNPVMATEMLRAKALRIMANIGQLRKIPSADLVRSKPDGLSLSEIQIRLDDIVRFRLEPLVHTIVASGLDDRTETIRFLETQLAYDERQFSAQQHIADVSRNAMTMYSNGQLEPRSGSSESVPRSATGGAGTTQPETLMPQLSDTFIDRLLQITSSASDHDMREKFAEEYRRAAEAVVPYEQAVAYDRSVLDTVRRGGANGNLTRESTYRQIDETREEVRSLVVKVQGIYETLSTNLNPSTALMTVTGSPSTRVERTVSISRLALYGLLTMLLAIPIIVFASLIHNRLREEDAVENAE